MNIGTPLQALKFACDKFDSNEIAMEFLRFWMLGDVGSWPSYQAFMLANPDGETTITADDGTTRQAHYGTSGRQPWDDIRDAGWGPEFCAGNALKYVRRDHKIKGVDRERDLKHARWYFARLHELAIINPKMPSSTENLNAWAAKYVLDKLTAMLTPAEVDLLENP